MKLPTLEGKLTPEKIMKDDLRCVVCGSTSCYEIFLREKDWIKMVYSRNNKVICRKCHDTFSIFDAVTNPILFLIVRLIRKVDP